MNAPNANGGGNNNLQNGPLPLAQIGAEHQQQAIQDGQNAMVIAAQMPNGGGQLNNNNIPMNGGAFGQQQNAQANGVGRGNPMNGGGGAFGLQNAQIGNGGGAFGQQQNAQANGMGRGNPMNVGGSALGLQNAQMGNGGAFGQQQNAQLMPNAMGLGGNPMNGGGGFGQNRQANNPIPAGIIGQNGNGQIQAHPFIFANSAQQQQHLMQQILPGNFGGPMPFPNQAGGLNQMQNYGGGGYGNAMQQFGAVGNGNMNQYQQQQQQQQQLPRDGSVFNSLTGLVLTVQRHYTTRMRFDRTDVRLRTADQQIVAIYAYGEIHAGRLETVPVNQIVTFELLEVKLETNVDMTLWATLLPYQLRLGPRAFFYPAPNLQQINFIPQQQQQHQQQPINLPIAAAAINDAPAAAAANVPAAPNAIAAVDQGQQQQDQIIPNGQGPQQQMNGQQANDANGQQQQQMPAEVPAEMDNAPAEGNAIAQPPPPPPAIEEPEQQGGGGGENVS